MFLLGEDETDYLMDLDIICIIITTANDNKWVNEYVFIIGTMH